MNKSAKSKILFAMQSALKSEDDTQEPPRPIFSKKHTKNEKIELLIKHLESVKSEVHKADKKNWVKTVSTIIKEKQINRLLLSSETEMGVELSNYFVGTKEDLPELIGYSHDIEQFKDRLFGVDAAITTTKGGIAENGAIILWPDQNEPRLMSLVPPVHIAVLEADAIFETLTEAMETGNWAKQMPTNAIFISSPSKTADIELVLAYGVHGPKEFIVIIVD
jgi:L-lactate dehydrogenase complex protein LldG